MRRASETRFRTVANTDTDDPPEADIDLLPDDPRARKRRQPDRQQTHSRRLASAVELVEARDGAVQRRPSAVDDDNLETGGSGRQASVELRVHHRKPVAEPGNSRGHLEQAARDHLPHRT